MGSYLLRSGRDESLLLGDLHLTLLGLTPPGLDRVSDLYIIVEVDSYGHYFKRARSRVAKGQAPLWGKIFSLFHFFFYICDILILYNIQILCNLQ